ncbi:MAG: hypothetical protein COZ12_06670 [Deltaproteobacteria bacterium CG_4_10_14_3_um_filter_60_8]|nr:MAG: hypothetical protein AUK28_03735 [Desulfobacterales bacterium CG2_30_60_27]PIP44342.1 MAG: hypothetical protein COX17_01960 [Deltaproteobacteria bacterium CG23_combo_of_CG06-09_8_20_14_all_60_8]PIY21079.1 MAG: hypothetical protein COZ12_06670 [Deltaproteobacteria bacterium CG_4_10_14_3_um_filter_60_8]
MAFFPRQRLFSCRLAIMTKQKTMESAENLEGKPVTDDAILKVAKEVVIKFIEVGRLTPANFDETFSLIYRAIQHTVRS